MIDEYHLSMHGRDVVIRPRSGGEAYPTHKPFRILIGRTVYVVKKCNSSAVACRLEYAPEKAHPNCPRCKKANWTIWLPLPIRCRVWREGTVEKSTFNAQLQWYIICTHCASIIDQEFDYEPFVGEPTEYVYDPKDNTHFDPLTFNRV